MKTELKKMSKASNTTVFDDDLFSRFGIVFASETPADPIKLAQALIENLEAQEPSATRDKSLVKCRRYLKVLSAH